MLKYKFKVSRIFIAIFLAFGWILLPNASAKASNVAPCDTYQINGGDEAFLMTLNTPLEFGGTVYDGNIYVSPKGTVTFGQGDFTFWDYPATPSISIAAYDYHAFANGIMWGAENNLYVRYGSTETSICVDWKVLPWGQSSGEPIYIRMIAEVNPENYTWTPTFQVSSNVPTNARYGVRYVQGGQVFPLTIQTITEPPAPNPTIEPTPEPTPTPTEEPTPEPSPSEPEPTPTPEETPSPDPSETPAPSPSPSPEEPALPSPQPTSPVAPEPEPTREPEPTPVPEPSLPEPTPTVQPTKEPVVPAPTPSEPSITPTPVPAPVKPSTPPTEPITSAGDIPANLTSVGLLLVDLSQIDPTELTQEQAAALTQAALETLATAEQGSPEYEQALEALFLAAQQDDIVLDPTLVAIPLLGDALQGAVELINFLGNAGSDMSPQVREQSEKVIVTAVIVTQIALAAVAMTGVAATVNIRSGK